VDHPAQRRRNCATVATCRPLFRALVPDDAAFRAIAGSSRPSVVGIPRDPRDNPIAIHRSAGIFCRNKNIGLVGFFAQEKSVTRLMNLQFSRNEVGRLGKNIAVLANACDLAGLLKLPQRRVQIHAYAAFPAQLFRQFRLVEGPVLWCPHQGKNLLLQFLVRFHPLFAAIKRLNRAASLK